MPLPGLRFVHQNAVTQIRKVTSKPLPETVEVRRAGRTTDNAGGHTTTYNLVATVSGRISPAGDGPRERQIAERLGTAQLWDATLPALTDVRAQDRLIAGTRTFEVAAVLAARSYEVTRRVIAAEAL